MCIIVVTPSAPFGPTGPRDPFETYLTIVCPPARDPRVVVLLSSFSIASVLSANFFFDLL